MLKLTQLKAKVEDKDILKGVDLAVQKGEVHAIMGPNGSGKSTLAHVLAGHPGYDITNGSIEFKGQDIAEDDPEVRALNGLFLAFQYPVEIKGVNNRQFLRMAYNAKQKHLGQDEVDPMEFDEILSQKLELVKLRRDLADRDVNSGFSGGEKKRNEIVQMAVLEPDLAVLDETDSGLDIDALKIVADGVNRLKSDKNAILLITHYQRLLDYIVPDVVHVMIDGKIVKSGDASLAKELEAKGYDWLMSPVNA